MKDKYHESCARVIAWDATVQEMEAKKVHSKTGLFWGKRQVAWLKWKCTGTPTSINNHNYLTEYKVCDKLGKWHMQCNCIIIITVQSAENQVRAELEVKSSFVELFVIDSSQSQDDPPTPPPQRKKRYLEKRHKVDKKDSDSDDDDEGGGKLGRGYGGSGSGRRKHKRGF